MSSLPSRAWERVYASGWGRGSTASSSDDEDRNKMSAGACAGDHSAEARVFSMPLAEQFACIASLLGRGDVAALEGFAGVAMKRFERVLTYTAYVFPGARAAAGSKGEVNELNDSPDEAKAAADAIASGAFGVHGVDAHVALALARLHAHVGLARACAALGRWRDSISSAQRAAGAARELLPVSTDTGTAAASAGASNGISFLCGACGRSLGDIIARTQSDVAVLIVAAERECGIQVNTAATAAAKTVRGVKGSGAAPEGEIITLNEITMARVHLEPCLDCCPWVSSADAADREKATQVREAEEAIISRAAFAHALREGV